MLTQDPSTVTMTQDPLAIQFMTQGQMGYMPQAQFLTPAEYGAFRTIPGGRASNFMNQNPGALQSWLIRNRGGVLGLPAYTFNTYNPAVNLQDYMHKLITQGYDESMAATGVLADGLFSMGLGSVAGMAFGGPIGIAAGLLAPSISSPMIDRIRDMRAIQNMTKSKIIGGPDVNMATGMGFNASSARSMDSFLRFQGADDALLKEGDWRKLLQLGIESGQFDFAGSSMQYKEALKKIRKSLTTMMEVAGTTDFRELMGEFKRMQTMGAEMGQYNNIARKENLYSRITGMSHSDMINTFGQQGALIYQQAGQTGYQGSLQAMANAATVTIGQRMGLIGEGTLSRYGGVSGLTQSMTQQDAQAQNVLEKYLLPYFSNGNFTGLDNSKSLTDLLSSKDPLGMMMGSIGEKITSPEQMMAYDRNKKNLMTQLQDKFGQDNLQATVALSVGKQAGLKGMEALEYGYRTAYGFDPAIAHIKAQTITSQDFREQEERERQLARRKQREEEDLQNNPFRKLARAIDRGFTTFGENIFGGIVRRYGEAVELATKKQNDVFDLPFGGSPDNPNYQKADEMSAGATPTNRDENWILDPVELGKVAAQVRSGNDSSKIDWSEKDGLRFGKYQIGVNSEVGKQWMPFLQAEAKKGNTYAKNLLKDIKVAGGFESLKGNKEDLKSVVAEVLQNQAKENPEDYSNLQDKFFKQYVFDPAVATLSRHPELYRSVAQSPAMQQTLAQSVMEYGFEFSSEPDPGGDITDMQDLARLSTPWESSGKADKVVADTGGISYGRHQISSAGGSTREFLRWLEGKGGDAAKYAAAFRAAGGLDVNSTTSAGAKLYKKFARTDPRFLELEDLFIKHKYYDENYATFDKELQERITKSKALQRVLYSESVQMGYKPVRARWKNHAQYQSDEDFIKYLYNTKYDRRYWKNLTDQEYYNRGKTGQRRKSEDDIKRDNNVYHNMVHKRRPQEMAQALQMLREEKSGHITSPAIEKMNAAMGKGKVTEEQVSLFFEQQKKDFPEKAKEIEEAKKEVVHSFRMGKLDEERKKAIDGQESIFAKAFEENMAAIQETLKEKVPDFSEFGSVPVIEKMLNQPGVKEQISMESALNVFAHYHDISDIKQPELKKETDYKSLAAEITKTVNDVSPGEKFELSEAQLREIVENGNVREKIWGLNKKDLSGKHGTTAYIEEILKSSPILANASDKVKQAIFQNESVKARFITAGLGEAYKSDREKAKQLVLDTSKVLDDSQNEAHRFAMGKLQEMQSAAKHDVDDLLLPGIEKLSKNSEYEKDVKEFQEMAYGHNATSNPAVAQITRINALRKAMAINKGNSKYDLIKDQLEKELGRVGFSTASIKKFINEGQDFSLEWAKHSTDPLIGTLNKEELRIARNLGSYLGANEFGTMAYGSLKENFEEYDKKMNPAKGPLTINQLAQRQANLRYHAQLFTARIATNTNEDTFSTADLLTQEGAERALKILKDRKMGTTSDAYILEKIIKKIKDGKTPSYADLVPLTDVGSQKGDSAAHSVRFNMNPATPVVDEVNAQTKPQNPAQTNASGADPGGPLKDGTVQKLNDVLERLIVALKGIETRLPPSAPGVVR